ncbi:MAG: hypothetical protein ACREUC_04235 [Steroidobacteraceae bacterium]
MKLQSRSLWHGDRAALSFIALGYLPWVAGLNLAWEAAHVSLYTLWSEAEASYVVFSVVHCTAGDVMIGAVALLVALILGREGPLAQWRWRRISAVTALAGTAYTIFSEWMNTTVLRSWTYAEAMPTLELASIEIGASPLAQWLLLPPLALYLARKTRRWPSKTLSSSPAAADSSARR